MTTPEDRILELALEEVMGGRRPPDLVGRILERARRPAHRLRLRRWAWAAAAVLLVAVAVRVSLRAPPGPEPLPRAQLTPTEEAQAGAWIALQRETIEVDLTDPTTLERLKGQWMARRNLLDLLEEKPAGWAWARPRLLPLPEGSEARDVRGRLLEILARAPGAEEDPLILDRIRDESFEIDEGALLVLAERDSAPARALLERRVDTMPPGTPLAPPAAFLALRGDRRGEAVLRRFLASPKSLEAMPAVALACAAGLRRLGDGRAWPETVATLRSNAEAHLASEDRDRARGVVAALVLVAPAVTEEVTIRLGDLDRRADRLARVLRAALPDAAAIRGRLAELID